MVLSRLQRRTTRRRGATLVEFAVVVPIFFIIIFGMVDIGRGFMVQGLLQNAARVGCRTGVLQGKTNSDVTTAVDNAFKGQGITGYSTTVSPNNVAAAATGDQVTVTVSVPAANISWLPGAGYLKGTLSSTYTLLHE